MSRRDDERVADILDAATQIVEILQPAGTPGNKDRIRQLATERRLEIIGRGKLRPV